ncbi:PAAR domain-containing protein [Massilia sp. TS11]|uniref:PAAR domain-containing protein n=1 Tax=Massilia sp. TS11 TaxID=2908003 RepID=UPI001EDAA36E|nr:PAAR domain-containing protein [Massilia sp. TS11]
MKRHTITLGASTTAGGKVVSASSAGRIGGAKIALEGDSIFCPACRSEGIIGCVEPRNPETWNGKKVALENDLCCCACPIPPRLMPSQSVRFQVVAEDSCGASPSSDNDALMFDDRFILLHAVTNEPLRNVEYALRRASGQIEFGSTDGAGRTHLLSAKNFMENVDIFV